MRLNSIQFLTNTSMMMSLMFIPNLAVEMGASFTLVGIIMCINGLCLCISSYFFSKLADTWDIKKLLDIGLLLTALAYFLQIFAYDLVSLALIRGAVGICIGIYPAALIMHIYGHERSIGKFSSFGALGWAVGFLGAGIIGDYNRIFITSALLTLFSFFIALTLPRVEVERIKVDYFSLSTIKKNLAIYLSFFLRHSGAVGCWTIFTLFMKSVGADMFWTGVLYCINPLIQFIIMRRLDNRNMEMIVIVGYILSAVAFISLIPVKIYYHIIPCMIIIGLSWSFLFVGSTELLLARNRDKATAAGFLNSVISLSMIFGALLGGIVSDMWGFSSMFMIAVVLSLVSMLITVRSSIARS